MIWPAILIGLLASMHCIGMCGPIALALPVPHGKSRYISILFYNTGRVITYGLFGALFGSIGSLFVMAGLQQFLSILAGTTILIIVAMPLIGNSNFIHFPAATKTVTLLKARLGYYLKKHSFSSLFLIGMLNGLLPCGMVYTAVIGAIATGSTISGSSYMMLFGLGTVPAMFMVSIFKNKIPIAWRFKLNKALPFAIVFMGVILIIRGMNLGIPYISPEISSEKPLTSHCCTK